MLVDKKNINPNQGRLNRALSKLPGRADFDKIPDIEEYLISQWQNAIKAKQGIDKKNELNNLLSQSAGDFAYSAFFSKNWIAVNNQSRQVPVKKNSIFLPLKFAAVGRVLTISLIVLFFSFLAVEFIPKATDKCLALIDNTLNKPIGALNRLVLSKDSPAVSARGARKKTIVNKQNLKNYIINNQDLIKSAAAKGINSILVEPDDINGRVAGAEDGSVGVNQKNNQSCLYKKIKDFVNKK